MNNGGTMQSLVDLPEEVLIIIARLLDATTLGNLAGTHPRLLHSAAQCIERLRVPSVSAHLQNLLRNSRTTVRYLNLSNCYSHHAAILDVIITCPSLKELNVVNCNLDLSQLRRVLAMLTELETLSFSYLGEVDNLEALVPLGENRLRMKAPIRQLYIELNPTKDSLENLPRFLSLCGKLERLQIHIIGSQRVIPHDRSVPSLPSSRLIWTHLKTVIVTTSLGDDYYVATLLEYLFANCKGIDKDRFTVWNYSFLACYIYEDGKFNTEEWHALEKGEGTVLRDSYQYQFDSSRFGFPWGSPRGLILDYELDEIARRYRRFFQDSITWSSDLVELDLSNCLSDPPGGDWSHLIKSSPKVEALAIPFCFFPAVLNYEGTPLPCEMREMGWRDDFPTLLTKLKLKKLFIEGTCPHHRAELEGENAMLPRCRRFRDFRGIDKLTHLEELTVRHVHAWESLFADLTNKNVRIVKLDLDGESDHCELEDFIENCVELRYFKIQMYGLSLDCDFLWNALAQGELLEQLCVGTVSEDEVNLSTIRQYLPRIIEKVRVLHVHADNARNRDALRYTIEGLIGEHAREHPNREFYFEIHTLSSFVRAHNPWCYPGRSLCEMTNHIAKIKPIGWDLP